MKLEKTFFESNRLKLKKHALIILTANGLLQRNGDVTFPFRQESNFWYLTGIDEPDFILVISGGGSFLVAPVRSDSQNVMEGSLDYEGLERISGLEITEEKEGWEKIEKLLEQNDVVSSLVPGEPYQARHGFYSNPSKRRLLARLKKFNPGLKINDLGSELASLRSVKQPEELESIRSAIEITLEALTSVQSKLKNYRAEYEVEADITASFNNRGSQHAFTPIIAAGGNAAIIHYMANSGEVTNNQLLLLDIGAEVNNYAADITRTLAVGKPSQRHKDIVDAVSAVQAYALSLIGPGILFKEYEEKVEKYMGRKLKELGLIKSLARPDIRKYYPHSTSHFLGLDTHDTGNYRKPFKENMVITVEPGIYIPKEQIGVRIEDDVLITKNGSLVLSGAQPGQLG